MFWMLIVFPRAAAVALLTSVALAVAVLLIDRPVAAAGVATAVGAAGLVLTIQVARWEARQRGGTGEEGSGPIEPFGPIG